MATQTTTQPMRDEILEFVRKSEETITEASRKWAETICGLVPGEKESIRKVVEDAFDLTETVMKNQREFATSVLDKVFKESASKGTPAKRAPAKPHANRTTHKHVGAA